MVLFDVTQPVSVSLTRERRGKERRTHLLTVAAAVVETVQAPPAVVFLHALQCQIPTAVRLTESCLREEGGRVSFRRLVRFDVPAPWLHRPQRRHRSVAASCPQVQRFDASSPELDPPAFLDISPPLLLLHRQAPHSRRTKGGGKVDEPCRRRCSCRKRIRSVHKINGEGKRGERTCR
jgi:hypothetical protein